MLSSKRKVSDDRYTERKNLASMSFNEIMPKTIDMAFEILEDEDLAFEFLQMAFPHYYTDIENSDLIGPNLFFETPKIS